MVTKRTEEIKNDKIQRILRIYTKLMDGKTVNKQEIAARYNVHPRSIQRDIKDITDFLERDELNTGVFNSVIYDKKMPMVTGFNMKTSINYPHSKY